MKRKGGTPPSTRHDRPPASRFRRRIVILAAAALSAITGVISYSHGLAVVRLVGNAGIVAYLVPLVPDLMIVTSSLTLIEASAMKAPRPPMAMAALVAGIGWTVAMNVAAGVRNGPGGAVLDAGIPLAFVFTFESLLWLFRRGRGAPSPDAPDGGAPVTPIEAVPTDAQSAAVAALKATTTAGNPLSQRQLEARFGLSRSEAAKVRELATPKPSLNGHAGGAS